MPTGNHWYNLNEQRQYPLDASASAVGDNNILLPQDLLVDLQLRWDRSYGQYAYISAAHSSPGIVTLIIHTTDNPNSSLGVELIAGVSIVKDRQIENRVHRLETFQPGVDGFIVLGSGVQKEFSVSFSSPINSLISQHSGRASNLLGVSSLRTSRGSSQLRSLVKLEGVSPLKVQKAIRTIGGVETANVISIGLDSNIQEIQQLSELTAFQFTLPCGRRFENRTCLGPKPIETINGVTPNCEGEITLEFTGCATIGRHSEECGVFIDCSRIVNENCPPPYVPDEDGVLPRETNPPPSPPAPPDPPDPPDLDPPLEDPPVILMTLPYCQPFDYPPFVDFTPTGSSNFELVQDDSPTESRCIIGTPLLPEDILNPLSYGVIGEAKNRINLVTFNPDIQTLYRQFSTEVKILTGVQEQQRAGILLNFHSADCGPTYYAAVLNLKAKSFEIVYQNGANRTVLVSSPLNRGVENSWYLMSLAAVPANPSTSIRFTAILASITHPEDTRTLMVNVNTRYWLEDSGKSGLFIDRTRAYFSYYRVAEL